MNTHDLIQLQHDLMCLSAGTPTSLLAQTALWLNPQAFLSRLMHDEDNDFYYDPIENLPQALDIAAEFFPQAYCQAVQSMWAGQDWLSITSRIFECVEEQLGLSPGVVEHEGLYFIPLEHYGLDRLEIETEEFRDIHRRLLPVLTMFGLDLDATDCVDDAFELARPAAHLVLENLIEHGKRHTDDPDREQRSAPYRDLAWLVSWLFGMSGNTLIDCSARDYMDAYGGQGMDWCQRNIDFAREIQDEARAIYQAARRGLEALEHNPALRRATQSNARRAIRFINKSQKGDSHANPGKPGFRWPDHDGGADGAAAADQLKYISLWSAP
jgi:hypothetical protein